MKPKCNQCVPVPTELGFYWATLIHYFAGQERTDRVVVEVRKNGFGQTRVFVPWYSRSFGLEEFRDWSGPLADPKAKEEAAA